MIAYLILGVASLAGLLLVGRWFVQANPAQLATILRWTALVLGAEGAGLRRLTRQRCDVILRLPISDAVESLNLAAAAAVALYALSEVK